MKAVTMLATAFASLFWLVGCAEDGPTPAEVQEQLRRGASGQGELTPGDNRGDNSQLKPHAGESDVPR